MVCATDSGATLSGKADYVNGGNGIYTELGSTASGNTARSNSLLELGGTSAYRANTVTENAVGTVVGGVNRGDNYCAGPGVTSALCP